MNKRQKLSPCIFLLFIIISFTACTQKEQVQENTQNEGSADKSEEKMTETTDATVLICSIGTEQMQMVFQDPESGEQFILAYTGGSDIKDKYGTAVSAAQISAGEIADIKYETDTNKLKSLKISDTAWTYEGVNSWEIKPTEHLMRFGNQNYKIDSSTLVISQGEPIELKDLNPVDVITMKGFDKKVYSIIVEKGHGYLSLDNDESFTGGWIDVGTQVVKIIEENMLLVVPEGDYPVTINNKGIGGIKNVNIARNEETILDVGDLREKAIQMGSVEFAIAPENAVLTINGKETAYKELIVLGYGTYKIAVTADGYTAYEETVQVQSSYQKKTIELKKEEQESNTNSNSTAPSSGSAVNNSGTGSKTETKKYTVSVKAPIGAELYLDGSYKGKVPVDFQKVSGTHTVTLRKSGFQSKTFAVDISNQPENQTLSFDELTQK